jgi:hypothetical protein
MAAKEASAVTISTFVALGSVELLDSKRTPRKVPCNVRGRTEEGGGRRISQD